MGVDKGACESKGCCWGPLEQGSAEPWCFKKNAKLPTCNLGGSVGLPFDDAAMAKIRGYFEANIDVQGSGAVVAAPDHNTGPGGDYYYHWMRDGALSMGVFLVTKGMPAADGKMRSYVRWVQKVQNQQDPNGIDVRTEPKFTIPDGRPYTGGWCRPQTDGPALRALTLAMYAAQLGDEAYAKSQVAPLIKRDLDWVRDNWRQQSCDLWEEIRADGIFWNRMSFRAALKKGGALLAKLGLDTSGYDEAFGEVTASLKDFTQGDFVIEAPNRPIDTASPHAMNTMYLDDGVLGPLSLELAKTVRQLTKSFCREYAINQQNAGGQTGVWFGRYPGDHYHGGNPWILLTAAVAESLYRVAGALHSAEMPADVRAVWEEVLGASMGSSSDAQRQAFVGAGDAQLRLIRDATKQQDYHMWEQVERGSGTQVSAHDLTWSYANVLKAMHVRAAVTSDAAAIYV